MIAIVSLLPIFGFGALFYIYFRKNVSVSIFLSITSIITILFIFGMVGILKYGTYLLFYGGIALLLVLGIKYKEKLFTAVKSVPFIIYTISAIVYLYLMKDAQLFFWDEYSHWGAYIKEMYYFHKFYDASSVAANLSYPPGVSIWDYFIVFPTGFTEGKLYFAYFLILFGSTLVMYEKLSFKQIHWVVLIFSIQMILFANFGHGFSSIYVDHIIGAVFAGLILIYINDKFSGKELYLLIFPLITLSLVKEVGLILDVLFLGFIYFNHIFNTARNKNISYFQSIKHNKKTFFSVLSLFVVILIVFKSWGIRQEIHGISKSGITMSGIVENVFKDSSPDREKLQEEIHGRFLTVLRSQQLNKNQNSLNYNEFSYAVMHTYKDILKFTGTGVFIFILVLFALIYYTTSNVEKRKYIASINLFLVITFCIHVILLYVSYLNGFGSDALRVPSYVRYMNTIVLPILMVQLSLLLPVFQNRKYSMKQFDLSLIVIIFVVFITNPYFKPLYSQLENGFKKNIDIATKNILDKVPASKKIFVVFPVKNNGSLNNILKYSLIPAKATISQSTFEDSTSDEMLKIYSQYDYVWFTSLNQELLKKNQSFLKAKNEANIFVLYKVTVLDSSISFEPIL